MSPSISRRRGCVTTAGATSPPSELGRIYADLGWKGDRSELHLVAAAGAIPSRDRADAGATARPRLSRDLHLSQTTGTRWPRRLNGKFAVAPTWTVQRQRLSAPVARRTSTATTRTWSVCSGQRRQSLFKHALPQTMNGFPPPVPARPTPDPGRTTSDSLSAGPGNQCALTPTAGSTHAEQCVHRRRARCRRQQRQAVRPRNHSPRRERRSQRQSISAPPARSPFIYPTCWSRPIRDPGTAHHPYARQYRFTARRARRAQHLLRALHHDTFDVTDGSPLPPVPALNVARSRWRTACTAADLNGNYTFERFNPMAGSPISSCPA